MIPRFEFGILSPVLVSQRQVVDTLLQPHKFGYPYLTSAFYKGVLIGRVTSRSRHITCRYKQSLVVALIVASWLRGVPVLQSLVELMYLFSNNSECLHS